MSDPIVLISYAKPRAALAAGSLSSNSEPQNGGGVPVIHVNPTQVAGLVPLISCTDTECRSLNETYFCCFPLKVFGTTGIKKTGSAASGYENDLTPFYIDVALYNANPSAVSMTISLEKCEFNRATGETWTRKAILNNNSYGIYYALNSISGHKTYGGYLLNWGAVLGAFGAGIYRIKFNTLMRSLSGCLVSPEFTLKAFDCNQADATVKFEFSLTGMIGSATTQGALFDFCGINYYDSIRLPGFFGLEKVAEYKEVMLEFQNGKQQRVRDEAILEYEFYSKYFPKEYHDRLKIYALMSDRLVVSDYNIVNSDYNIKQLPVVKNGNYQPEYQDKHRRRMAKVTIKFRAGVQNIIKTLCCAIK